MTFRLFEYTSLATSFCLLGGSFSFDGNKLSVELER